MPISYVVAQTRLITLLQNSLLLSDFIKPGGIVMWFEVFSSALTDADDILVAKFSPKNPQAISPKNPRAVFVCLCTYVSEDTKWLIHQLPLFDVNNIGNSQL